MFAGACLVAHVPAAVSPAVAAAAGFQALAAPQRLLDTRPGEHTADSAWEGGGALAAGLLAMVAGWLWQRALRRSPALQRDQLAA